MDRLYVIVRADLSPGAQIAQACHALSAFASCFPDVHREWHQHTQNLVVVSVPDEQALLALLDLAQDDHGIDCAPFYEPDFGHALTAFAAPGQVMRLVSSLPLALRAAA